MAFRVTWLLAFLGTIGIIFASDHTGKMNPSYALTQLIEGNKRYQQEKLLHPNRSKEARISTASGQNPFAIILGCSDSRVAPELIFDQGIGDLFVVRVAGNVAGAVEVDSIEYAAFYLKSSIVMVLGHQACGAVQAVMNGQTAEIEAVASLIAPGVEAARSRPGDVIENAVKDNVRYMVAQLKKGSLISRLIEEKKLQVVGGYYDFQSGAVQLLAE